VKKSTWFVGVSRRRKLDVSDAPLNFSLDGLFYRLAGFLTHAALERGKETQSLAASHFPNLDVALT